MYPEQLIEQAKNRGLDGICLTEHDIVWKEDEFKTLAKSAGLPIFRGMEVSTDFGHVLVFGLPKYMPGIHRAETLRKMVDSFGGFMILAHPFRGLVHMGTGFVASRSALFVERRAKQEVFQMVDALEVFNGCRPAEENQFALETSKVLGLKGVAGSDAHYRHEIGECATSFERDISSEEELIEELRAGRFTALEKVPTKDNRTD